MSTGAVQRDAAFVTYARDLIALPDVATRWNEASALPYLSIGGLACHLSRQNVIAAELMVADTDLAALGSADEHYARAPWVQGGPPQEPLDDDATDVIEAAQGPNALLERVTAVTDRIRRLLDSGEARDVIGIPWQGWSLSRPDFQLTRMLEIVVHSDDLAVSLGVDLPPVPDEVFEPVRDLLIRLAVRRHGQSAVISTLTRRERTTPIYAF